MFHIYYFIIFVWIPKNLFLMFLDHHYSWSIFSSKTGYLMLLNKKHLLCWWCVFFLIFFFWSREGVPETNIVFALIWSRVVWTSLSCLLRVLLFSRCSLSKDYHPMSPLKNPKRATIFENIKVFEHFWWYFYFFAGYLNLLWR